MSERIQIGYLCSRGHYCFDADPEEGGQCGSKSMGGIFVEVEDGWRGHPREYVASADAHLGRVIETWRKG